MAYTLTIPIVLRPSLVGLSLRAALRESDGDFVVKDVAAGFREEGQGVYQWVYASFPDGFRGVVVFYTGTIGGGSDFSAVTIRASAGINPEEIPGALGYTSARAALLDRLASPAVTVQTAAYNPATATATVIRGDDYKVEDGEQVWTLEDEDDEWPDGSTGAFYLYPYARSGVPETTAAVTKTVSAMSGSGKQAKLELTRTETAALAYGRYRVAFVLTRSPDGDLRQQASMDLTVLDRPRG